MDWLTQKIQAPDNTYRQLAQKKQEQLTKPKGSLGYLEDVAIQLAAMQRTESPTVDKVWVSIFAADHGIAEESVSAFPQVVTQEMVKNFANAGAAINVLSHYIHADFEVVDVGLINALDIPSVIVARAGHGTQNFTKQAAMTEAQLAIALTAGQAALQRALKKQSQLFIGGEMGISNTTSATALAAVLTQLPIDQLTGAGTGIDDQKIKHKQSIIQQSILSHQNSLLTPLNVLQYLGGFEIAALVGAYIFSAQQGLPVLVDGFIATTAALVAAKINPAVKDWFLYAHCSQEKGHQAILDYLNAQPLLHLNMRLGEGSGAATAVPLIQMACQLHNKMATFQQANITIKT